jgi:hypothetical protein
MSPIVVPEAIREKGDIIRSRTDVRFANLPGVRLLPSDPLVRAISVQSVLSAFGQGTFPKEIMYNPGSKGYRDTWMRIIQAAEGANQPGKFTAFIGYEWTSLVAGNNLHRNVLFRDGKAPPAGSRLDNPDLARTLQRIADRGRDGFYTGETADLIVAEMKNGGGLISHEDLANYQPKWRTPIEFTYRNHRVISMAPASSGGLTLALMANILDGFDLKALGPSSPQRYHLMAEASRRAFAPSVRRR